MRIMNTVSCSCSFTRLILITTNSGTSVFNTVDMYNSATRLWSTAQLSVARGGLAATSVGNLAIFVGGYTSTGASSSVVDFYNIATETWSTAQLSPKSSAFVAAVTVGSVAIFAESCSSALICRKKEWPFSGRLLLCFPLLFDLMALSCVLL